MSFEGHISSNFLENSTVHGSGEMCNIASSIIEDFANIIVIADLWWSFQRFF